VQAKINFEKLENFQHRKNVRLRTTILTANHHDLTTKNHQEIRTFSKTTLKTPAKPRFLLTASPNNFF
jgi:hypothetical protein